MFRRLATRAELVTRPITDAETQISDDVASALLVFIREDLRRLGSLLGDGWDWGHLTDRELTRTV